MERYYSRNEGLVQKFNLPPISPLGILLAITLASLSHWRSSVPTHLLAPKARPEFTNGL